MPQWAGSSWYWLRFMDPHNTAEPFARTAAGHWGPVDLYAGADHAVAHLIYARFWQKVLFDAGLVDHHEPFSRLEFLGYVLASDGSKISKRSGNSRNPDDVVAEVGADAFRLYEMAMGPFEKSVPWSDEGLNGQYRFLRRVYAMGRRVKEDAAPESDAKVAFLLHRAIADVSRDVEAFKFNTAVAALMIFIKESDGLAVCPDDFARFLQLLAPLAPHIAEEIWHDLGCEGSVHHSAWPVFDPRALHQAVTTIPVQVNGKRRAEVQLPTGADETTARDTVLADPQVGRWLDGKRLVKFVFVPDRIVNLVVAEPPAARD